MIIISIERNRSSFRAVRIKIFTVSGPVNIMKAEIAIRFKSRVSLLITGIKMGYLQEIKRRGRVSNPFFIMMGIDVESFGNGQTELSMQVRPDMQNGVGWLQGGLYTAICDEAMALALLIILENGEQIATISESTSYLEGVRSGKIIAKGKVVKKGRHVAFTEGCVKKADGDETVLSQTRASFAVIKKP